MSSTTPPSVQELPINKIRPHPNPLRPLNDVRVEEIGASMLSNGQLSPILVRSIGDGYYEMVDGSHRLAAARLNNWATIRCEIRELTDDRAFLAAWSANANRNEFMDGIAEARGFAACIREGYTQVAIAREISRPQQYVSGRISLLRLEPEIQDLITRGLMPVEHGIELSRLDLPSRRVLAQLSRRDAQTPLTLDDLRALARLPWDGLAGDPRVQPLLVNDPSEQIRRLRLLIQEDRTRIGNLERLTEQLQADVGYLKIQVNNISGPIQNLLVTTHSLTEIINLLLRKMGLA